jgi:hypothetical protein
MKKKKELQEEAKQEKSAHINEGTYFKVREKNIRYRKRKN